ncbi:hypothetical protein OIU84_014239 [Salix udensis]|uniref:Uncharacterized protein n=1 Tax=Salix udensis TaxID=889485 RepID=A0AAD6NQU9_9ROSI|nr:hypothetical protein OIU84_014239 [Salix udensis]
MELISSSMLSPTTLPFVPSVSWDLRDGKANKKEDIGGSLHLQSRRSFCAFLPVFRSKI